MGISVHAHKVYACVPGGLNRQLRPRVCVVCACVCWICFHMHTIVCERKEGEKETHTHTHTLLAIIVSLALIGNVYVGAAARFFCSHSFSLILFTWHNQAHSTMIWSCVVSACVSVKYQQICKGTTFRHSKQTKSV